MRKVTKALKTKGKSPSARAKAGKKTVRSSAKRILPSTEEVLECLDWLRTEYPNAQTELTYETPFQLLTAVILSAQCTDERVNKTTPALFAKYPDAPALAKAPQESVEKLIQSCGFFRMKAKSIRGMAQKLLTDFKGEVPKTIEELTTLPGVGRKTASVIRSEAFDLPAIAVDTHVKRVSARLGWSYHPHPEKIEFELRELVPEKHWSEINILLILHGRRICKARKPLCEECGLKSYCAFFQKHVAP